MNTIQEDSKPKYCADCRHDNTGENRTTHGATCNHPDACSKMEPFKNQCLTCATTHMENGKVLPGTMHCKDPKYEHLMGARCWNYTAKEVR